MTLVVRAALAFLPALMLGLYASYPMLAFLPWVALVPWVVLYTADRGERVPWSWYFAGAFATWILQYPQAWKFGWYAPIVMGLVCIPWWLPFAPVLARLHGTLRLPRSLAVALAWTALEWLRATFTVAHFDLYRIGYSQARFPILVQFADLTGVYGVTFLVAAANGWLADWIFAARERGWLGALRAPRVRWGAAAILASIALLSGYGTWRMAGVRHEPGPTLALVQPNLPHSADSALELHLAHIAWTREAVPPGKVDLIVWPENAILDDIRREGAYLEDLGALAREKKSWILVGALASVPDRPGGFANGAWLVDPEGTIRGEYRKQLLFPWSEYIPGDAFLGQWLPPLQRAHRYVTRLAWGVQPPGVPGERMEILEFPWRDRVVRIAPLICVENTYPPLPAAAGRLGADFFLNITSEGLVGGPVQEQLLRIAMLRAIENRMAYVRVGNTGISGVVDATGRTTAILRGENGSTINTPGVLLAEVPFSNAAKTPYSTSRDLFALAVVLATALLLAASFAPRRTASEPRPRPPR
jgi:apolipoprotein N-acyltransferase